MHGAGARGQATVLVVDDSDAIRDSLGDLLEDHGYAVTSAENGQLALERLRAGLRPRAILLDLMMPVMDGWEFRRAQVGDPDLKGIPVIVITAFGPPATALASELPGVNMIAKPLSVPALLAALERLCTARDDQRVSDRFDGT